MSESKGSLIFAAKTVTAVMAFDLKGLRMERKHGRLQTRVYCCFVVSFGRDHGSAFSNG